MLFPMSVVPINVGRPRSVRLVEELLGEDSALVGVTPGVYAGLRKNVQDRTSAPP